VIESSPDYDEKPIKNTLTSIILKAKKEIILVTPYLVPPDDVFNALTTAS